MLMELSLLDRSFDCLENQSQHCKHEVLPLLQLFKAKGIANAKCSSKRKVPNVTWLWTIAALLE